MFDQVLMSLRVSLPFALAAAAALAPALAIAQSIDNRAVQSAERIGADRNLSANESRMRATGEDQAQVAAALAATDAVLARASPEVRVWVRAEGQRQAQSEPSQSAVEAAARGRFGSDLSTVDINLLIQLVMAETSRQAEQDLRDQLAQMQAANQRKRAHREAAQTLRQDRADLRDGTRPGSRPVQPSDSRAALAAYVASVSDGRDTLAEMGEMQQLRLQMHMDRRQKALEVLSNLLKKVSDTQDTIIGNLK